MPRGKKTGTTEVQPSEATPRFTDTSAPPPKTNVHPAIIAQALKEMIDFDSEIASLSALKGAAINRYEQQGVDRELLASLNKLARKKNHEEARAYIQGLTRYAAAANVIDLADDAWTLSVKQADMFTAATGDAADDLRAARARKDGLMAGRKGHLIDSNPHGAKPGSPEYIGWRDGHGEGAKIRRIMKPGSENVTKATGNPTPRKRRGAETADETPPAALTQQQQDEAAFRTKGTATLHDAPETTQ